MFEEFGPRGAEHYNEDDPQHTTQEVIVPPAQEPYGPGIVPPEEV